MQVQRCSVSDNTTLTCSEKGDSFSAANRADAANTAAALSTMWLNRSTSPSSCCSGRSNSAIDTSTPNSLCVVDVVQISIVRQGRAVLSLIIAFARRSSVVLLQKAVERDLIAPCSMPNLFLSFKSLKTRSSSITTSWSARWVKGDACGS